ncbi:DUF4235 domain-containing protein [Zhihengliuella sp.]|uniref:DUF4235 domain-containing protein n=1 Tax=Zhihengliuella sp. TaxID=1954483 RepID=UPI0028121F30|nr:DUF4235 domain-containing protein [Zhihengliuella sp.]
MATNKHSSKSAKILYRPLGLISGLISGAVATAAFRQVWKRVSGSSANETPTALQSEYGLREILLASAIQGAIFAFVKAVVDRGGARAFEKVTGEWPGD